MDDRLGEPRTAWQVEHGVTGPVRFAAGTGPLARARAILLLAGIFGLVVGGCRGDTHETASTHAPAPAAVATDATGPIELAKAVGTTTYVFRSSFVGNLTYTLDCLAERISCSNDVFAAAWKQHDWTADDAASLDTWRELRSRYKGAIDDGTKPAEEPPLPISYGRPIEVAVRLAGFGARDLADYETRFALFASDSDVARMRAVLAHFRARGEAVWRARRAELARAASGYAAIAERREVSALASSIAKFYVAPIDGTRQVFELVARPAGDSSVYAQNLGDVSTVEVRAGDPIEYSYSTVSHETFHGWFKISPIEQRFDLAVQFARSGDPLAGPAYGLLDESVATAFEMMILGLLDPAEAARLDKEPNGFYEDPWIDGVAKKLLPVLRSWVERGKTIYDPDFVATYLGAVHEAFPAGLPPIVYLRPLACATEEGLAKSTEHLAAVSDAPLVKCSSDPGEAREIVATHRAWGTAILVTKARVANLAASGLVDAPTLARVRAQNRSPFVVAARHAPIGVTFVFVATDDTEMSSLIDAFAAQSAPLRDGVFAP